MSSFTKVLESYQMTPGEAAKKSKNWFNQQITLLGNPSKLSGANFIKTGDDLKQVTKIKIGSMYIFKYDPKNAQTLPYYDMFPLVFPFGADKTSFTALNLHYIHPFVRAKVLDALQVLANNDKYDESTKLRLSWHAIQGISKMKLANN